MLRQYQWTFGFATQAIDVALISVKGFVNKNAY